MECTYNISMLTTIFSLRSEHIQLKAVDACYNYTFNKLVLQKNEY